MVLANLCVTYTSSYISPTDKYFLYNLPLIGFTNKYLPFQVYFHEAYYMEFAAGIFSASLRVGDTVENIE